MICFFQHSVIGRAINICSQPFHFTPFGNLKAKANSVQPCSLSKRSGLGTMFEARDGHEPLTNDAALEQLFDFANASTDDLTGFTATNSLGVNRK